VGSSSHGLIYTSRIPVVMIIHDDWMMPVSEQDLTMSLASNSVAPGSAWDTYRLTLQVPFETWSSCLYQVFVLSLKSNSMDTWIILDLSM
jgi:hypothetical protein